MTTAPIKEKSKLRLWKISSPAHPDWKIPRSEIKIRINPPFMFNLTNFNFFVLKK